MKIVKEVQATFLYYVSFDESWLRLFQSDMKLLEFLGLVSGSIRSIPWVRSVTPLPKTQAFGCSLCVEGVREDGPWDKETHDEFKSKLQEAVESVWEQLLDQEDSSEGLALYLKASALKKVLKGDGNGREEGV